MRWLDDAWLVLAWLFPDPAIDLLGLGGFGLLICGIPHIPMRLPDAHKWALAGILVLGVGWTGLRYFVP